MRNGFLLKKKRLKGVKNTTDQNPFKKSTNRGKERRKTTEECQSPFSQGGKSVKKTRPRAEEEKIPLLKGKLRGSRDRKQP